MDPEYSRIIGLEVVTDNLFETDAIREFLQKEQASVGRKFAAIEVIFELLIETERGVIYNRHRDLSFMFWF
jgi:hypothetical protein